MSQRPCYIEVIGDSGVIQVRVSPLERRLWLVLETDPLRFFPLDEIATAVYGDAFEREFCIRGLISDIRRKLAAAGVTAIRCRRGFGYRLAWRSIGERDC